MDPVSARFPEFPWDTLAEAKQRASEHPDGLVDLSIGTPVDDTPKVAQSALALSTNAHGYPTVLGPERMRQAAVNWLQRRFEVTGLGPEHVLATVGSKEFIGNLPMQLGLGRDDLVVIPELAYPTYEVGARYAGCEIVASDSTLGLGPVHPTLMYINSPANPHGRVLGADHLRKVVSWARERGTLLVSDECYLEFIWDAPDDGPFTVLHPDINGGSLEGILAVHSLSKRSNMAGYRVAFVAGDPTVIAELVAVRKHLGFMVPAPIQRALAMTLADDAHVDEQYQRYARRRERLMPALEDAGFRIDASAGGLYLWATRDEPCRKTVDWFAERGILVAPGEFYGAAGAAHVRIGLTATDERVDVAAERISSS